ncbi:hypothetical protein K432DRAFT_37305 [Lepidopterella palustris CBS 459.81]|uniref:Uncharacterized protein n=1 Tax=Lepidopterella palustris CBS 459.81 TaxID=1314670 RepID=A0A8E2EB14_9PEZI|nr:hypothetical protein K432DRAFT_37305 [Lepidopterella palustris CBS 459.81]
MLKTRREHGSNIMSTSPYRKATTRFQVKVEKLIFASLTSPLYFQIYTFEDPHHETNPKPPSTVPAAGKKKPPRSTRERRTKESRLGLSESKNEEVHHETQLTLRDKTKVHEQDKERRRRLQGIRTAPLLHNLGKQKVNT